MRIKRRNMKAHLVVKLDALVLERKRPYVKGTIPALPSKK